jgi:glycosyltransferase involved in cell wall biosynthesis
MRVLILCTNSDEAGAPIHVQTLILSLRNEITFFAVFGEEGPVAERLREHGIAVEIVPKMRSRINLIDDAKAFCAVSRHVDSFQPDLIHAHSSKAGMLGRLASLYHRIPCLYTVHGWGWRGLGKIGGGLVYILERLLSVAVRSSSYIYVSRSVEYEAQTILGISKSRGKVIYNGAADLEPQPERCTTMRILMPARVTAAKDHESLIKAFEQLDFDAELWLCGGGTDKEDFLLKLRILAPTRNQAIRTLGPRSDVSKLLQETHVFALISNFEALPISIIEAMSAGKAIVASDVGGVSELIVSGVNGLLVPKNDVASIAAAFTSLRDPHLRAMFAKNARMTYGEKFTAKRMAVELKQSYMQLVRRGRMSRANAAEDAT